MKRKHEFFYVMKNVINNISEKYIINFMGLPVVSGLSLTYKLINFIIFRHLKDIIKDNTYYLK